MEHLFEYSDQQLRNVSVRFRRYLYDRIHWKSRLIGIKGARGTGKTTLLLQYLAQKELQAPEVVYFSLDDLYFTTSSLVDVVSSVYKEGAQVIGLDEVHKYPGWAREVKIAYDRYPDLQIVFTGSSIIDIAREEGDLSRRMILYELYGLSYREYLQLAHEMPFKPINLNEMLGGSTRIRDYFPKEFRPLKYFKNYLHHGYYPFFMEETETFGMRLNQLVRMTVEYDLAELKHFDIRNAKKLLQLLSIIASSVPFKPNISKLAQKTGIHRNSLVSYLYHLEQARLISLLYPAGQSTATLQKPEKIALQNTNLSWALSNYRPNTGNLRETFVLSQLFVDHQVSYPPAGDFMVNHDLLLEIGGKDKSKDQIRDVKNARLVVDDIEFPTAGRIPLWLLGFLY